MTDRPLRVGLLGLGLHGGRYARHLRAGEVPGLALHAAWTRSETRRAEAAAVGLPVVEAPEAILRDPEVDAVVLALPVGVQTDRAAQALGAGKAVLVEKPLGERGARARALAERGASRLTVAHTLRFDPLLVRLRDEARRMGPLVGFRFEQRLEPRPVAWEDEPALAAGGVLVQTGVHALDALRFCLADRLLALGVSRAELGRRRTRAVEDWAELGLSATLDREVVEGSVVSSKLGRSRHHRYALLFEDGGLEADFVDRCLYVTRGRERAAIPVPPVPTLVALLGAFEAFVRGRADNPVPPEEGVAALELIDAAYARARAVP